MLSVCIWCVCVCVCVCGLVDGDLICAVRPCLFNWGYIYLIYIVTLCLFVCVTVKHVSRLSRWGHSYWLSFKASKSLSFLGRGSLKPHRYHVTCTDKGMIPHWRLKRTTFFFLKIAQSSIVLLMDSEISVIAGEKMWSLNCLRALSDFYSHKNILWKIFIMT